MINFLWKPKYLVNENSETTTLAVFFLDIFSIFHHALISVDSY